jgi:uncharacterized membrane protein YccC
MPSCSVALLREWPLLQLSDKTKFACKVALSLTLAYMVPMALGWSQPSTAATTVMLIAATGGVRDSLMKGTLRIAGTVAGAVIGLTLIALFAQDRLLYLLAVSIVVSMTLYLYKAYQGDGTIFMLAAVVMLLVFNGGNVEDAFLYGLDRAYMTAFGVVVYTLVGSFIWPLRAQQNLAQQALELFNLDQQLYRQLSAQSTEQAAPAGDSQTTLIKQVSSSQQALHQQWLKARGEDQDIGAWSQEWQYLLHYQRQLSQQLATVQEPAERQTIDYRHHIPQYDTLIDCLAKQFDDLIAIWENDATPPEVQTQKPAQANPFVHIDPLAWRQLPHLQQAKLTARVESLRAIARLLQDLSQISRCLQTRTPNTVHPGDDIARESAFIALDAENLKTALQVFATFWFTSTVWILLNPPGGFFFVTLSSVLVVLVSFTALQPKLLYILFTLGFIFALPCYIFLLPQLSRSYELALFLFSYTAFAHYVFPSPVNIFFMFGLFTLGISNNMAYNLDVMLGIMLMFYLVITALLVTMRFTFANKPEYLFALMRRRLFRHMSKLLALHWADGDNQWQRHKQRFYQRSLGTTLTKMRLWASQIDTDYFQATTEQALTAWVDNCEITCFRANAVITGAAQHTDNAIIAASREQFDDSLISAAALALSEGQNETTTEYVAQIARIEQQLDSFFENRCPDKTTAHDSNRFYVTLNLLTLLWESLMDCELASRQIDWQELKQSRF